MGGAVAAVYERRQWEELGKRLDSTAASLMATATQPMDMHRASAASLSNRQDLMDRSIAVRSAHRAWTEVGFSPDGAGRKALGRHVRSLKDQAEGRAAVEGLDLALEYIEKG